MIRKIFLALPIIALLISSQPARTQVVYPGSLEEAWNWLVTTNCSFPYPDEWLPTYGQVRMWDVGPAWNADADVRGIYQSFKWQTFWDRVYFYNNKTSGLEVETIFRDNLDSAYLTHVSKSLYYDSNMPNWYLDTQVFDNQWRNIAIGTSYAHGLKSNKDYHTYILAYGRKSSSQWPLGYDPKNSYRARFQLQKRAPSWCYGNAYCSYSCINSRQADKPTVVEMVKFGRDVPENCASHRYNGNVNNIPVADC